MKFHLVLMLGLLSCEDKWLTAHNQRCAGWMSRAHSSSDSLVVETSCATILASKQAERAADAAMSMSAAAMGAASSARAVSR